MRIPPGTDIVETLEARVIPSLFDDARLATIRRLVTDWIALPDGVTVARKYAIPASPDDVFWLCDLVEKLAGALRTADAAYSEAIDDLGRELIAARQRALAAEDALRFSNAPFVRSDKRG